MLPEIPVSPFLNLFKRVGCLGGGWLLLSVTVSAEALIQRVEARRVEGLPDSVALIVHADGNLGGERLRMYFDTHPGAGEGNTGADFLLEGPSFYAYPKNGSGWTWERIGTPIFQQKDGSLICIVSAKDLSRPFEWFAELTSSDWGVRQRWPDNGTLRIDPAGLPVMPPPAGRAEPVDLAELLAARPVALSVGLNGGPDLSDWSRVTPSGFAALSPTLRSAGFPEASIPTARLSDARSGKTAVMQPLAAFQKGNAIAWNGQTLDTDWILIGEKMNEHEVRFTGWLSATAKRVVRVDTGLTLPLEGRTWVDDIAGRREITGQGEFGNFTSGRYGADARQSLYPIGVVEDGASTWVVETDPDEPRVFALSATARGLAATYDLALTPETRKFPGQATFRFSIYSVERGGEDGFRAALAALYARHPAYAERRVPHSGLWMPFSDIGGLPQPEDFGFSFFEKVGDIGNDVANATRNGALTLMYTEPWLYWLPFEDGETRTPARALEKMRQISALGSGWSRDLAASGLAGATRDANGDILTKFMDLPWNKGARMEVNTDPDLEPAAAGGLNRAAAEWKNISRWIADERVHGIYLDSMDAIVQPDHAPAALHAADYPATYTPGGLVPVMAPNVPQYEFVASLAKVLRNHGKFLMANFPLTDAPFINRWIDIPGEETDWWNGGQYNPNSRLRLDYRRALSGQKPFGFLQSTDFATFKGEPLRRYFETALYYGFQPSFFSHNAADNPYWLDHGLLERDRHLFRTFVPLTRRVSDAGWQPMREVRLESAEGVRHEQFGRSGDGLWHVTLQNQTARPKSATLRFPDTMPAMIWIDPLTGFGGWIKGGDSLPLSLDADGLRLLDFVSPANIGAERSFLQGWRSGAGEAAAATSTLASLENEYTAGIRVTVSPAGPVVAGETSRWTFAITNLGDASRHLELDGAGDVIDLPAGATRTLATTLAATGDDTRRIAWTLADATGLSQRFERSMLVRSVPAVEATGPGARLLVRDSTAELALHLTNHTATAREVTLDWLAAANGKGSGSRTVTLPANSAQDASLHIARPESGGALDLELRVGTGDRIWWSERCSVVFLDAVASLASQPGVKVATDSTFGGYSVAPLNDGIAETANLAWNEAAWASEDSPAEHWVRLSFPQPVAVGEVVVHWNREGGVTYTGREGMILGEVATGQELPIANWKSTPGSGQTRVTFPRQVLKSIRVVQNPNQGTPERPGIMWVSEIELN